MRIAIILAGLLAASSLSTAASAQDGDNEGTGFYAGLSGGIAAVQDTDIRYYDGGGTFGGSGATDTADGRIHTKSAAEFKGVLGYDFGTVRTDVEIAYQRNKVSGLSLDRINGAPVTLNAGTVADVCDYLEVGGCSVSGNTISFTSGSRIRQLSALANVWLDLPIGDVITPYAGGGVGVAGFELDGEGKARFAWQLGAGVAVRLNDHIALTLDYRHRQAKGGNLPDGSNSGADIGQIRTNSGSAGLRFTF